MDPVALKILKDLPLPNLSGLTNNFYANGPIALTRHKLDTKGNWNADQQADLYGATRMAALQFRESARVRRPGRTRREQRLREARARARRHLFDHRQRHLRRAAEPRHRRLYLADLINTNAEPPRLDENLGLDYLGLPGTNGPSREYGGWPQFSISSYAASAIQAAAAPAGRWWSATASASTPVTLRGTRGRTPSASAGTSCSTA